ncbi:jg1152 [Pararge aegeria aegeria]|uniref:Jg1152 protein n=1 Tax=Pararge aegeria aegeria TaxID=348720 RepID=A0A8S4QG32_9NEOP|nr:jg1152 [Pararge aegeria aegeria]
MEKICQTCLVTGVKIYPMSFDDTECYRLFITKIEDPLDVIYICVYCKGVFRKINRFIKQSRLADEILKSSYSDNAKILQKVNSSQLSISETICHYIGSGNEETTSDVKILCHNNHDDVDDIPLVMLGQKNDDHDSNNEYDNCDQSDNADTSINIKQESNTHSDIRRKQKKFRKKKGEVREGFSSRMVTETDEYKVIKLTKEELILE